MRHNYVIDWHSMAQYTAQLSIYLLVWRMMDSRTSLHNIEDMKDFELSPLSSRGDQKDSALSIHSGKRGNSRDRRSSSGDRAQTKTRKPKRDPGRERISDEDSSASYCSGDHENTSLSDRSFSSQSRSPSPPRVGRIRRVSSSPSQTSMCS